MNTNKKNFWVYNEFVDVLGSKLKPSGIAVYLCLIRHADRNAQCYPSHNLIAKKCGISRRTVITAISKIVKLDLIKVQKRETNNGGDTSNLYIIKELPNHIHTEKEVPSPVQNLHPPCEKSAHEGQQEEGQLYLKDNETKDEQAINNNTNCNYNELSELNSTINLSQAAVKALSKLPDNNKRQEVLDVLAASMKKGTIRKPEAYLQTLIQRSLDGDFTPIQKITNKTNIKNDGKCGYCNNTGKIQFQRPNGTRTPLLDCKHGNEGKEYIEMVKRDYGYDLINATAQPDNEQPGTQGLTHINELNVINSFRNRYSEKFGDEQCDFEVPF